MVRGTFVGVVLSWIEPATKRGRRISKVGLKDSPFNKPTPRSAENHNDRFERRERTYGTFKYVEHLEVRIVHVGFGLAFEGRTEAVCDLW